MGVSIVKPIKKVKRDFYESRDGQKLVPYARVFERCGKCKKAITQYWRYCAYCGEVIER